MPLHDARTKHRLTVISEFVESNLGKDVPFILLLPNGPKGDDPTLVTTISNIRHTDLPNVVMRVAEELTEGPDELEHWTTSPTGRQQ